MNTFLSERVERVKPSPTLAITAKAIALKNEGKNIISLSSGEPDFDTPDFVKQAAIEAIQAGKTKYTPVDGVVELKQAIINKFQRDNNLEYKLDEVMAGTGGKQLLYNLFQATLNEGDEVLIPTPYWVSYPDMVMLADATPVLLPTDITQNFKITAAQLEAAITDKTRLFVINSPSNPTGMTYSRDELAALGEVLRQYPKVLIATDDMYEHIYWGREEGFQNIVMACPDLFDRTIVLNGVSKAYSMTGWRIGYAGGPAKLIGAMKKVQSQSTSNPCSIAQKAAVTALVGGKDCINEMLVSFKRRHDMVVKGANEIAGFSAIETDGTFYVFPNVRVALDKLGIKDDVEFAELLLVETGVALVPGTAFGLKDHIRFSIATSDENLTAALSRIKAFVEKG